MQTEGQQEDWPEREPALALLVWVGARAGAAPEMLKRNHARKRQRLLPLVPYTCHLMSASTDFLPWDADTFLPRAPQPSEILPPPHVSFPELA